MNKPLIVGLVGIVLVATLLIGVQAYGRQFQQDGNSETAAAKEGTCAYHDRMQVIMASGTYADLVALRAESGRPMMPFVTDEASFVKQQELHKQQVAEFGENAGKGMGCGMSSGTGAGMHQGKGLGDKKHNCPMMNG